MTIIKKVTLSMITAAGLLALSQAALKALDRGSNDAQGVTEAVPKLKIVSSIPWYEFGIRHLGDVVLLDNGEAWAVGYDGQHVQRVYHSKDRGKNWDAVDVPGNGFTLKALSFSDSQNGWAVGANGLVIRTTNGGRSWEKLKPPTQSELHAARFVNSRVGYVAGGKKFGDKITDEVWGSIEIFCTKDGGETWRSCYEEDKPGSVFQITTTSESEAFAVLDGVRLIKTDNQGMTWRQIDLAGKKVSSVALAGDGSLWVVGSNGTFERSEDGGRTWRHVSSLGDAAGRNWWKVTFNHTGLGLAVGEDGALALAMNNGSTWNLLNFGIQDHFRGVSLQDGYAIISGASEVYSITVSNGIQK